jgi:hypothetical protein
VRIRFLLILLFLLLNVGLFMTPRFHNDFKIQSQTLGPIDTIVQSSVQERVHSGLGLDYYPKQVDARFPWDNLDVPGEDSKPSMRYYLRKYYSELYTQMEGYNLTLRIRVEDPDGVESVNITFTLNDGPGVSAPMDEGYGDWYQSNLTFTMDRNSYSVRYIAKDSLGNIAMTPQCTYKILFTNLVADGSVEMFDTPDLWYVVNTTGHTVTWNSNGGFFYSLFEDNHLIEKDKWFPPLTIIVDNLYLGDHVYLLRVSAGGWSDSDTVTVHVVGSAEDIPLGAQTDSVQPIQGFTIWIWGVILGSIAVAIVLVVKWRR